MPDSPTPSAEPDAAPRYLTTGGRQEYENTVARYKRGLTNELDRRAAPSLDRGVVPELTSADVRAAMQVLDQRLGTAASGHAEHPPRSSIWAAITLTAASIGIGVMPNFLDGQPWQYVLFAVFVVIGVVGLVLTWIAGTAGHRSSARGRRRPPPETTHGDS
jgi:hypothetical protein